MSDTLNNKGVVIIGVFPGSRAASVGIQKGDRIISMNDVPVNTLLECIDVLEMGTCRKVSLIRGNSFVEYELDTTIPPVDASTITG